ncbi:UNVERIFIED_CONTAM: hypothetical protein GTU68_021155 [Idotea baltica]|nr:hypothetical protein [Idotea baltica]
MSVSIRLARHGRRKKPFYRVVAADTDCKRDGRFIEKIGTIDPLMDPPLIDVKEDRIRHWLSLGAQPTKRVAHAIEKIMPGYLPDIQKARTEKIQARRAKRKAAAKK